MAGGNERASGKRVIEVPEDSDAPPAKDSGKDRERAAGSGKERGSGSARAAAEDGEGGSKAAPPSKLKPPPAAAKSARPAMRVVEQGMTDEALTLIGKEKYEAQEEKLKDVARQSMSMLRDFSKLSAADRAKRVAEIRKALMKYEMQYIRSWENQEKRRRLEIAELEAEAARCRQRAEEEGERIVELRQVLEQERRRRKRYEGYEDLAKEVNQKKTRPELKDEIEQTTADIATLKQQRTEQQQLLEQRMRNAHLLQAGTLELKLDVKKEQQATYDVLQVAGADKDTSAEPAESGGDMAVEVIS